MPALIFFKRKWLIACDDLVIPNVIEALVRLMGLTIALTLTWVKIINCAESSNLDYFLYAIDLDLFATSILSFIITYASSKGSILEVEKRTAVPKLLYLKLVAVLIEISLASTGIWFFTQMKNTCRIKEIFIKVITVCIWIYILAIIFGVVICYDTLGSSKYWKTNVNSSSFNFFKKAQNAWKLRLKFFCCCADISDENELIYVEISTFLASFLNDSDLAPTDILAGIITLSHKHALERRKHLLNVRCLSQSETWLRSKPIPEWMTTANAIYFLRIAKSTYGWLAFFHAFRPWSLCGLYSHIKCCKPCSEDNSMKVDNCCYSNFAAMQKITGYSESDIVYASFENNIHEPAFIVAIDHNKKSVVIAIRGTRSFSDLVTDIDAEALYFPIENQNNYRCHRGVLRSAMYIQKKINDLNLLEISFNENPSYNLVITGHSLGGSIAALLGFLLRQKYPNLQCYAYGPMAAISPVGILESLDFIFSVVVGDDMASRLCSTACNKLRKEIIDSLRECKLPKFRLLISTCWYHISKYFKLQRQRSFNAVYDNIQCQNDDEFPHPTYDATYKESSLFAPGRILYFEKNNWKKPVWLTGINLENIIVNPGMISDHQPHTIQFMLEKYALSISETSTSD